jgi:hypothetical protein
MLIISVSIIYSQKRRITMRNKLLDALGTLLWLVMGPVVMDNNSL